MMQITKNSIEITGKVQGVPEYDHELFGEKFYRCTVSVLRLSGTADLLPVLIPGRLLEMLPDIAGKSVYARGQLRTYNKIVDGLGRLEVVLFVSFITYAAGKDETQNVVELRGCVASVPVYRVTPFGREICDIMLAVGRAFGKCSYVPCVIWGRNGRYASRLQPGTEVELFGRLQSRNYEKVLENGETVTRTVHEVSVQWIKEPAKERAGNG